MEERNEERNYGADPWREPKPEEGDTVIFTECGRVLDKTCYRAYWLMLVKCQYGGHALLVKHGGGEERINLFSAGRYRVPETLAALDSDARYLMLFQLYWIHTEARRSGEAKARAELTTAFVEGRLKKRKVRGQSAYKVFVERVRYAAQTP